MRKLWFLISVLFVLGMVVFTIGIVQAFQVTMINPSQMDADTGLGNGIEVKKEILSFNTDDGVKIAVMGDSIARGTGDQSGFGLTKELVASMEDQGIETEVKNIAVDGYVSKELLELIRSEENIQLIKDMDIAIISIGGNDLRRLTTRESSELDPLHVQERLDEYLENLEQVMQTIRNENKDSYIMLIGLYNPFDSFLMDMMMITNEHLNYFLEWNYQTQRLIEQDALSLYVPTFDLFKWSADNYISYDRIHPNAEGFQAIAERIAKYFSVVIAQQK